MPTADSLVNAPDSLVDRARDIMGRIRYQIFTPEVTTMGNCPKCGGRSRGAGVCAACLGKELDALIGGSRGSSYAATCKGQRIAEDRILVAAEALAGGGEECG